MKKETRVRNIAAGAVAIGILVSVSSLAAKSTGETFTGTAAVKSQAASATAKVTIVVDRYIADADREKVVAAVKTNDNLAVQKALAGLPDIGYIELGSTRTPIKYAYSRSTGGGRLLTVVTATPILFLGGSLPNAKPKEGYNLALALLVLDSSDKGDGELAPATKVKMGDSGAIVTDEYGSEVIRLTGVTKVQAASGSW